MDKIRILIADDHAMFREGLRLIIERQPDMTIVGEAVDGQEVQEKALELAPDVILMDINMPVVDGVTATRLITQQNPRVGVIILTMYRQDEYVFEAIKNGALGYILKDASSKDLLETIRAVHRGEALLGPEMAKRILAEFRRLARDAERKKFANLTTQEVKILNLVAQGASNKEIAEQLYLSEQTIKNYLSVIFQKLHVNNRTEAAMLALREGLIPSS